MSLMQNACLDALSAWAKNRYQHGGGTLFFPSPLHCPEIIRKASFSRAVIRSCRNSGFQRTVVQLYDSCKTQNAHNFGHRHATDLYFTFLEMAEKVFLVKFLWHRRGSNPRLILVTIFCSLMLNDHGYILEEESHFLSAKNG